MGRITDEDVTVFAMAVSFVICVAGTAVLCCNEVEDPHDSGKVRTTRASTPQTADPSRPSRTVLSLKEECKAHNLTVGGRKSDLEHRLETHYAAARATLALQSCYGRNDSASKKTEADPQRRRKEEGGAAAPALSSEQRSIPDWRVWFFIPNVIGYVRLVMTLCSFSYAFSSPVTYCILYGSSMVLGKCRLD